jgi:urocanate hydratase
LCFDFGFGPFRWVCTSGKQKDLDYTDQLAEEVLKKMLADSPVSIHPQLRDNVQWISRASQNNLVVGSKARILYANAEGRIRIAAAFNRAIKDGTSDPLYWGGTTTMFRNGQSVQGNLKYL